RGATHEAAADPPRHRPRAVPSRERGAGGLPPLPRAALAAQEPRAAVRGYDAASRAAARADRLRRAGSRGRAVAGPRLARPARVAVPSRGGTRLPVALRGVRPASARGDGMWLSGRLRESRLAAGGDRRRRAALRPRVARGDR